MWGSRTAFGPSFPELCVLGVLGSSLSTYVHTSTTVFFAQN